MEFLVEKTICAPQAPKIFNLQAKMRAAGAEKNVNSGTKLRAAGAEKFEKDQSWTNPVSFIM